MPQPETTETPVRAIRGVDWFARGRDAFTEGLPCQIDDLRMSRKNIQAWYAGYNHQAMLNSRKNLPAEDVADVIRQLATDRETLLRERARELAGSGKDPEANDTAHTQKGRERGPYNTQD